MRKFVIIFISTILLVPILGSNLNLTNLNPVQAAEFRNQTFIPFVNKPDTKLVGMYFQGATLFSQESFDNLINNSKTWSGGKLSIIGTFMNAEFAGTSDFNVVEPLRLTWENGYVPFINFEVNATAYEIAVGRKDQDIQRWANAYQNYSRSPEGEQRFAFIAPLQEMNSCQQGGCWTEWGGDPGNYQIAYRRIHQIFEEVGVPAGAVRWVFAPNGWSHYQYDHPFEDYYPGDEWVDVVAISAYNFGGCLPDAWQTPKQVYNNPRYTHISEGIFLDRMRQLAPGKPIFIAQTGTAGGSSAKNSWLDEAHDYLAKYPGVSAVLYFNLRSQCDWVVYDPPSVVYDGYVDGVLNASYQYKTPQDIKDDPSFITK
jgi:hypothetical protein